MIRIIGCGWNGKEKKRSRTVIYYINGPMKGSDANLKFGLG